jgi:peptidyl-prolyl cis-trans isomerase SDCCAG10
MGEAEVGADDKPVEPIRLLKVEVVWNPFDDIVPRLFSLGSPYCLNF